MVVENSYSWMPVSLGISAASLHKETESKDKVNANTQADHTKPQTPKDMGVNFLRQAKVEIYNCPFRLAST